MSLSYRVQVNKGVSEAFRLGKLMAEILFNAAGYFSTHCCVRNIRNLIEPKHEAGLRRFGNRGKITVKIPICMMNVLALLGPMVSGQPVDEYVITLQ